MKARIIILILFAVFSSQGLTQRLSTGFDIGFQAWHQTKLKDNYLYPPYSYFIYYVANTKREDAKPVFNQFLNGYSMGLNLNVDYKRFMLTTEFNVSSSNVKVHVYYPFNFTLDDNWSILKVQKISFSIPVYLSCKLTGKSNGPFIYAGGQYSFNSYTESRGYSEEIESTLRLYISDYEMYGVLYNYNNYFSMLGGIGMKKNDKYNMIRFIKRVGGEASAYPLAEYTQIDIMHSRTLNFQKLKKGNIIYIE